MKPEHQQIIESTPEDEPRSKLDPFRELILRWRSQGKTYRRIANLLDAKCGLLTVTMTVHDFVRRRSRPRKLKPEIELEMERPPVTPTSIFTPPTLSGKLTPEERERQRAILKALREKSVVTPKEDDDFPLWDPDKPLTNKPNSEEK